MKKSQFGLSVHCYREKLSMEAMVSDIKRRGLGTIEVRGPRNILSKDSKGIIETEDGILTPQAMASLRSLAHVCVHNVDKTFVNHAGEVNPEAVETIKQAIDFCASFGQGTVTFHLLPPYTRPSGQPNPKENHIPLARYWDNTVKACYVLGCYAKDRNVKVAVETTCPVVATAKIAKKFMEDVHCDAFGITLDIGHFWAVLDPGEWGEKEYTRYYDTAEGITIMNQMLMDMATTVTDKIFHLHLHDVLKCAVYSDHRRLGSGVLPLKDLFSFLERASFAGTLVLELGENCWPKAIEDSFQYMARQEIAVMAAD